MVVEEKNNNNSKLNEKNISNSEKTLKQDISKNNKNSSQNNYYKKNKNNKNNKNKKNTNSNNNKQKNSNEKNNNITKSENTISEKNSTIKKINLNTNNISQENKTNLNKINENVLDTTNINKKDEKIIKSNSSSQEKETKKVELKPEKKDEQIESNLDSVLENRNLQKEKLSINKEISVEEKEEKTENTFENKTEKQNKKSSFSIIILILVILLILFIGTFCIFTVINNNPSHISKGVYISGIDVSSLTKDEAKVKLEEYYNEKLSHDITIKHQDYKATISPSQISLVYNIDNAISSAFSIGKNGNIFNDDYQILNAMLNGIDIEPTFNYNKEDLEKILNNFSKELPDAVVESNYYIEDNNIIITKGTSGYTINTENTIPLIESTFSKLSFVDNTIEIQTLSKEPEKLDASKIHSEIYKEAKNAYYTTDPYVVYPSENGTDFKISVEEAQNLIDTSTENETKIPLKTLYPSVTTNMIGVEAFPDLLATFSTKYSSNKDRTTNLRLAANKINGHVLLPGETFSYNKVVGERTIAAGYKEAAVYQNGEVVQGLGGGICQISSTLFNAVLLSNLEIVELHNHQFVPSYVTAGRDATVVYGVKDFKFKNSRKYAIKINCSVSGGVATFNIWGKKQDTEYDVSVYAKVNSKTSTAIKSSTYRTLKLNGNVVKTENIANFTYKVH